MASLAIPNGFAPAPRRAGRDGAWGPAGLLALLMHGAALLAVITAIPARVPPTAPEERSVDVVFGADAPALLAPGDVPAPPAIVGEAGSDAPSPPVLAEALPVPDSDAATTVPTTVESPAPPRPMTLAAPPLPPPPLPEQSPRVAEARSEPPPPPQVAETRPAPLPERRTTPPTRVAEAPRRAPPLPSPRPAPSRRAGDGSTADSEASRPAGTNAMAAAGNADRTALAAAAPHPGPPLITDPRFRRPPRPPDYPARAIELDLTGIVLVRAFLDPEGDPRETRVQRSSGHPMLDAAALAAVRGWAFEPASRAGQRIAAWVEIPVRFQLR